MYEGACSLLAALCFVFSEREDPEVASAVQLIWEKYAVNEEQVGRTGVGGAGVGGTGVGVFGILLSNKVKAASASKANALCYSCACSLAHDN